MVRVEVRVTVSVAIIFFIFEPWLKNRAPHGQAPLFERFAVGQAQPRALEHSAASRSCALLPSLGAPCLASCLSSLRAACLVPAPAFFACSLLPCPLAAHPANLRRVHGSRSAVRATLISRCPVPRHLPLRFAAARLVSTPACFAYELHLQPPSLPARCSAGESEACSWRHCVGELSIHGSQAGDEPRLSRSRAPAGTRLRARVTLQTCRPGKPCAYAGVRSSSRLCTRWRGMSARDRLSSSRSRYVAASAVSDASGVSRRALVRCLQDCLCERQLWGRGAARSSGMTRQ